MKSLFPVCILLFLLCFSIVNAKDKVDFSGWGAAGYMFIDRNPLTDSNQPTYYLGKLQADIKINDELEAQLDLRGNSFTNNITFREFSAKFKYMKYLRFKMGNIKRPFGQEYTENREDLPTINRSIVQRNISLMGYSRRSVSIMAYYNYSDKRPDFPYTYAVSIFKDNSLGSGIGLRGLYHIDKLSFGLNYLFQNIGGNFPVSAHGIEVEGMYRGSNNSLSAVIVYVRDPNRSREILNIIETAEEQDMPVTEDNAEIYSAGIVTTGTYEFDIDALVIKKIEPVIQFSFYVPNSDMTEHHIIQALAGANFYFNKKVRIRFNADLRLTKTEYDDSGKYATNESSAILELQVRF
jgi:hypothetical protein